jgi:hypothetical protein
MKLRQWIVAGFFLCSSAYAEVNPDFIDFLKETKLNGDIRSYDFNRNYGAPKQPNQSSYSFGGMLNLETAEVKGFSADFAYYAADNLGLNTSDLVELDKTLPGNSVNVLGQAYLQYRQSYFKIRAGDQYIKTPWLNAADSRMIPALYRGVYADAKPNEQWDFTVMRILEYKSRNSHAFNKTNLYIPGNYGGSQIRALQNDRVLGVLAGGSEFKPISGMTNHAWYYKFYDYGNLLYGDAEYILKNTRHINPIFSAQIAREWGDGRNELNKVGMGKTDSTIFGALIGLDFPDARVSFGFNGIPKVSGAYRNGDVVSPYTSGYVSDPLYTTSQIQGLVEKVAGYAYKISAYYYLFDQQFKIGASYANYYLANPVPNNSEVDFDFDYEFKHSTLKGLALRDRIGVLNGNPALGRFLYNWIQLQYTFQ